MPLSERNKRRRFVMAGLMVEILRPSPGDLDFSMNDRLVGYCVVLSTFGPHPMGLNKIADLAGLSRATTKRALDRLMAMQKVARRPDGTYALDRSFSINAMRTLEIDRKLAAIVRAARELELLGEPASDYGTAETTELGLDGSPGED